MSIELDIGPLSWVKGEIDLALERASAALAAPSGKELAAACTHLHQAHGALAIVGLDGITEFSDALEKLFVALAEGQLTDSTPAIAAAQTGIAALRAYLDGLMAGEPDQPLRLYPAYAGLVAARGATTATEPLALFFPDLTQRPPRRDKELPVLDEEKFAARIKLARVGFERGLLKWIKGDAKGISEMRNAVAMIEGAQAEPADRALWWIALGFFAALVADALPDPVVAKKLAMKIGAQIKKLSEGHEDVADRLLAEVLYQVAVANTAQIESEPAVTTLETIRAAYRLTDLIPSTTTDEASARRPQVHRLRELIAGAKEDWNRLCAGAAAALPPFHEKTTQMAERGRALDVAPFSRLVDALANLTDALRRDPSRHSDAMSLEVATALLLADNALDHIDALDGLSDATPGGDDFTQQVDAVAQRLEAVLNNTPLEDLALPNLDAMSRRAQERLLLASVAREISANLGQIEQTLDNYFRTPDRADCRAALDTLNRPLKQIEGALIVLGQDRAGDVLRECETQIAALSESGSDDTEQFEALAGKLSALGFFVEQLELGGQPDIDAILNPPRPAPVATTTVKLAPAFVNTSVVDTTVAESSSPAVPAVADTTPAPSADSVRLAESSAEDIDAELLAIFLEEAREVLDAVAVHLRRVHEAPDDQSSLTTLRRRFHTLKGSGRMVGLDELGESAWFAEQVMNAWLKTAQPASPGLLAMLDTAAAVFGQWVLALAGHSHQFPDPEPLNAICRALLASDEAAALTASAAAPAIAPMIEPLTVEPSTAESVPRVELTDIVDFDLNLDSTTAVPPAPTFDAPVDVPTDMPTSEPADPVADPTAIQPASTSAEVHAFPAPPPIMVGDVSISPTLFVLFMDEARDHLTTIQTELGRGGVPQKEFIRAAHTLGSISGTTGIMALHQLARAFEYALERLADAGQGPTDAQRFLFARCAGALDGMLGAVASRRLPGEEAELTAELQSLQAAKPEPLLPPLSTETGTDIDVDGDASRGESDKAPSPITVVDRREQRIDDEIDVQLLPLFLEESIDLMQSMGADLRQWRLESGNPDIPRRLQRDLHTLKGSARMAGAMSCGELLHSMESRIEQVMATKAVTPEMLDSLEASYDRSAALIDRLRRGEFGSTTAADIAGSAGGAGATAPTDADIQVERSVEPVSNVVSLVPDTAPEATQTAATPSAAPLVQSTHLRVKADLVDRLVNEAGEVAISRARIEGEMRAIKASLLELTENVIRLRGQLREIEIQAESQIQAQISQLQAKAAKDGAAFDPLEFDRFTRFQELTRMMAESVNDVSTVQHTLLHSLDDATAALQAQARLNRDLSQRLMNVRMVPFDTLAERLHRVVRQAAKDCSKRANLDIRGGQTGIDRSVLESISAPLEHLLRNAVAHGIETPEAREAAGKSLFGQIMVTLAQEGNDIVISLSDDGRGLDFERIRQRGIERGLIAADEATTPAQLVDLLFQSGFSTAENVTTTAGRGVGLDVVRSEIEGLGGRIETHSSNDSTSPGTTFRLFIPLTLAITQALVIRCGPLCYAVPSSMVEHASELKSGDMAKVRIDGGTEWLGRRYPWHYLPRLLGDSAAQPIPARRHWLLLIKGGTERIALEVDGLVGNQEIVIKAIGPQLARVPGVTGATVLGEGEITLILNPLALVAHAVHVAGAEDADSGGDSAPALTDTQIVRLMPSVGRVMVVDDSLTVRKVSGRLLARQGYEVLTAKDGADALEQLTDLPPDVMLVDIEMPRMDGFELVRQMRADPALKAIPVIMVTSRSADKHRQHALDIGANHYLGKPYDEEELLALIAGYISAKGKS